MAHFYRLIAFLLLAVLSVSAFADGEPFPPADGGFDTTYCNPSLFPQAGAGMGGIPASWTCTPQGTGQRCGWTDDSSGYFVGQCNTSKKPAACPPNSTMVGSGDTATCSCNSGFTVEAGQCVSDVSTFDHKYACEMWAALEHVVGGALTGYEEVALSGAVSHGSVFCYVPEFGQGEPANAGCRIEFDMTAIATNGDGSKTSYGKWLASPKPGTDDLSCTAGTGENETPSPPDNSKCKDGYLGTVNGVETCVPRSPNNGIETATNDSTTVNDGTNTTTTTNDRSTTCKNGVCTTTTNTTTTVTNNSTNQSTTTTTTLTTTSQQADFCAKNPKNAACATLGGGGGGNSEGDGFCKENPNSVICKDSKFGGACASGFTCDGDAVQCAIAKEQHIRACKLFDDESPESKLYNDNKDNDGNQTDDLEGNETIDLVGRIDQSDAIGGGSSGVSDLNVTVWGRSVTLPFSNVNPYLGYLGNILLAVSFLLSMRIVARG